MCLSHPPAAAFEADRSAVIEVDDWLALWAALLALELEEPVAKIAA